MPHRPIQFNSLHAKDIQHLEAEAIKEREKGPPHFPCCLQYCPKGQPSQGQWNNGYPLPPTARKSSYVYSAKCSPQGYPPSTGICPTDSSFLCPNSTQALALVQVMTQLAWPGGHHPIGHHLQCDSLGVPHLKQKEEMLLHKALSRSHQEAFSRDSKLVQKAREDYYWENYPHFNRETSCNMADIFQSMIKSASLLSSEIHKIKETWTGQSKLQYTNYALRTLPTGLIFFCPVSPSEFLKVMGLTDIHHPNALHCFNGVTHCLWCGKEGQNEGTVINHLQMTHCKLGLVCKKMLPLSLGHIWGIWCHSHKSCQLSAEGVSDELSSLT